MSAFVQIQETDHALKTVCFFCYTIHSANSHSHLEYFHLDEGD